MKAWILRQFASLDQVSTPLELAELPVPDPNSGELLIKTRVCGICHTELDQIEGRLAPKLPRVLGHQVVGDVVGRGADAHLYEEGTRVGVGWVHSSSGGRDENVSEHFRATGHDVDGGYAEYISVPQNYAYRIPESFSDEHAAPLLCAGAIGYRALRLANVSTGQRLGLTGFGASAHLVLQMARHLVPSLTVFVFARDPTQRELARSLGAIWAGDTSEKAPLALDAIIDTTPAWKPVVEAMGNLRPGGRLVINAIRKEDADKDQLLRLDYHQHLWMEREIKSVANITHFDIGEFLPLAASIPLRPKIRCYDFSDANEALLALKRGSVTGAQVLRTA